MHNVSQSLFFLTFIVNHGGEYQERTMKSGGWFCPPVKVAQEHKSLAIVQQTNVKKDNNDRWTMMHHGLPYHGSVNTCRKVILWKEEAYA